MPDLSDSNALQGPPGVSRPAAEASARSREAEFDVDLFVIGGGSGGVRAARVASGHGAKVMLAEEYRLGGTCVIRGCVPKKLFVYASRFSDSFDEAAEFGWRLSVPHFDWSSLVAAKDREITRLEGLYGAGQESAGVEVVRSRAVLEDAHTVRLLKDGRRVRARTILIATGARPELPPFDGIELGATSDDIFDLKTFPGKLVIGGAGYIAMEFAGSCRSRPCTRQSARRSSQCRRRLCVTTGATSRHRSSQAPPFDAAGTCSEGPTRKAAAVEQLTRCCRPQAAGNEIDNATPLP